MAFVKLADNYTDLIGKFAVALLAEGVDRNEGRRLDEWRRGSPSSRRAWIEMLSCRPVHTSGVVALLAEGVDRNMSSASALMLASVALLAEGVDRNSKIMAFHASITGRPPRGGRG